MSAEGTGALESGSLAYNTGSARVREMNEIIKNKLKSDNFNFHRAGTTEFNFSIVL